MFNLHFYRIQLVINAYFYYLKVLISHEDVPWDVLFKELFHKQLVYKWLRMKVFVLPPRQPN